MFTLYLCNPEASLHAQLAADADRAWLAYERDQDLECEAELAAEAIADDDIDSWPFYANSPIEVEEPEIVTDADLLGFPVDGADVDYEDEWTIEALDDDMEAA